ncbi:D-alanyl-D-alanine carboxypeptidase-like protein [Curtobacterium sp. PhB172]|uniref:M15 family metallopeptidase n=1 Tax=unclassified Curtobacterium TaxID=257496 RepID=UPI000FB571B9|nr:MULTISPECIES: M15 family metallopeptidase [unclassified Curtobacterium]ROQ05782.1 D-alanyl-D-alanine carboxypeptidase-like protein [Curtobacterium sp. PhB171]ROQ23071.1 D-alanyl-D-alanine carboxypeptidase-like protein [Curtobacterium sp. PhB170]ROS33976.1 D-alanyl-D-alanine carboxypeptidase-like protein [Curtobacterium sp. PhB131]ROS62859.1 D-alanyl-D-alanine carboxypeptidase-like protein [Curtobacterium sp. PhB172]ROS66575.1 D-alanyl-D-alanine carboxypeptidase-like protein [Curtobacterium 
MLLFAAAAAVSAATLSGTSRAFAAEPSNLSYPSYPESTSTRDRAFSTRAAEDYPNGEIPTSELTYVAVSTNNLGNQFLLASAATAFFALSKAFQAGLNKQLTMAEAYRDLARQKYLYNGYITNQPGFNKAAYPGTSIHGLGRAVDFSGGVNSYGTSEKTWMNANGPTYGWQPVGDGFDSREPWHFEYDGSYQPDEPAPPVNERQEDTDMKLITNNGRTWLVGEFTAVEIDTDFLNELKASYNVPGSLGNLRAALAAQYGDPVAIQAAGNVEGLIAVAKKNRAGLVSELKR